MKVSALLATAVLAIAPLTNALPAAHSEDGHISSAADYMPIDERDIHNGPIVRGAGALHEAHLQKRNTQNQRITGVRTGYSGAYRVYRQEIRKFRDDRGGRVHDLFLLALKRMYERPSNDVNSFWQLAGIHGRPFQGWAGDSSGQWNQNGYCTHGSTLFPTWHRPYLAYFEEVVWANAEYIVNNQIPSGAIREDYRAALMVLRLPYYDWAQNSDFPDVFRAEQWTLRRKIGGSIPDTFDNPLFSGKLGNTPYGSAFGSPFNGWSTTRRNPTTDPRYPSGSNNDVVRDGMRAQGSSLRQRTYQLLMNNRAWNTFSNRASGANGGQAYDSLESIHDTIHGSLGRGGHMSYVEYSAMDPVFFIHHANVDRLFAIWQAINPTTYVSSQVNRGGTYGVAPGTTEYRTSIMRPFKGLSGQYWTSDGVRDTSLFGYGYFETPKWKYSKATENQYAAQVRRTVEGLYGNSVSSSSKRKRDIGNATEAGLDASINNNKYYEWRINVEADKSDGNGTYFVHFFLGKPSRNPTDWYTQPELVGDYVCFTHDHQAAPGMDPSMIDNTVTGSVPLTDAMVKAFPDTDLNSLQPVEAIPFLIKNLRWRATDNDGNPIRIRKLKGLKVSVSINHVTLPTEEVPWRQFGEWELLTEIARKIGRDGGPDKVNVVPVLSSSAAPATSTTDAPAATTTSAANEATTTSEAATATSTEESAPAETSA